MGINLPCGNTPLTTTECGGDCDEKIERLAERVSEAEEKLDTIQEGAEVNVNADWEETDPNSDAYIENKPSVNYDLSLGDSAPTVGSAVVGSAVLGSLVDIILGRGDGTEDRVSVSGTGAIQITRDGDTMTIHVPVGEIDQLRNGTDTEARAWAANVLKQWLDERIAQIPADQFLDLNKTVFANPFTWSSTTYPGSINPNLDGKPVLVLALTDGENVRYSFLNMEDLIDAYEGVAPISVNGSQISHDNSGVTAGSYGDSSNQTPNFGDTFKALRSTVDAKGHVTSMSEHTVKIPDTLATQESAGLMSAEDKEKLDNVDQLYKTTCGNPITIDDADGEVKSLNIELLPVQDLHGYDKPWSAGAGKNKSPVNLIENQGWAASVPDMLTALNNLPNGTYTISFVSKLTTLTKPTAVKWATGFVFTNSYAAVSARAETTVFAVGDVLTVAVSFEINDNNRGRFLNAYVYGAGNDVVGTIGTATLSEIQIEQGNTKTDFAPYENICPITGRTQTDVVDRGKNLFDDTDLRVGGGFWYSFSSSNTQRQSGVHLIEVSPNTTYTMSKGSGSLRFAVQEYANTSTVETENPYLKDSGWKTASTYTFTTTANTHYAWLTFSSPNYSYDISASDVQACKYMLEKSATATDYAPYVTPTTKTVTLPHTVYGADVDVTGGQSKTTMTLKTSPFIVQSLGSTTASGELRARVTANGIKNTAVSSVGNIICNVLPTVTANQTYQNVQGISAGDGAEEFFYINIAGVNTKADYEQWLVDNNVQVVYELATPTDLQTTPTPLTLYKGDNVVSSDGDMCITYLQDRGDLTDFINEMKDCCEEVKGSLLENLVDGSAQGSLRGVDTAQEDANYTLGTDAVALGNRTKASGDYSVAEGTQTEASGLHSHAEGKSTIASGYSAHAEGTLSKAPGLDSHAEGHSTTASGDDSHAEGISTNALGEYSHAEGRYTTANSKSQHVGGEFNELDTTGTPTTRGTYVEIIGNGASNSARSNARTLDWNGNEALQGALTLGKGTADEVTITAAQLQQLLTLI